MEKDFRFTSLLEKQPSRMLSEKQKELVQLNLKLKNKNSLPAITAHVSSHQFVTVHNKKQLPVFSMPFVLENIHETRQLLPLIAIQLKALVETLKH